MFTQNENSEDQQQGGHVMDQPLSLGGFDDDGDNVVLFQTNNEPNNEPAKPDPNINAENPLSAFDVEAPKEEKPTEDEEAALIQKLKEKGYNVDKAEVVDEDEVYERNMKQQELSILKAEEFIALTDTKMVSEKIKWDLAEKYRSVGKQHLIGTEEFEIEVEAEADSYTSDERMLKIYADNIRRDIRDGVLAKSIEAKNQLLKQKTDKIEAELGQKKQNLQKSFDNIYNQGFLGIKFEKEDIQKAFAYISSGDFSKEIKNDPNSLAELALYRLHRERIVGKVGGPTYGEGVAAAVKELEGSKSKSTSHISNALQTNAGRSGEESILNWSSVLDPNSEELKDKKII